MATASNKKWWKNSILYQVYPHSFCDDSDDSVGDIPGIISKLHYLKDLGVDIICLSPDYSSPQDKSVESMGVNPELGTMEDMERLISRAKRLGIKIVVSFCNNAKFLYLFGKSPADLAVNLEDGGDSIVPAVNFWRSKGVAGVCCNEKLLPDEEKGEWDIFTFPEKLDEKKNFFNFFNKHSKSRRLIQSVDRIQDTNEQTVINFDDYVNFTPVSNTEKCKKMYCGLRLSLKGMPIIFEGAEKGKMTQEASVDDDVLSFYKKMIEFRKNSKGLVEGSYRRVAAPSDVYVFTRESKEERLYIYCNLTAANRPVEFYGDKIIFGNYDESDRENHSLKPYEFRIVASNI